MDNKQNQWWRWIVLFPAALIASIVASFVANLLARMAIQGFLINGGYIVLFLSLLVSNLASGAVFVSVGSIIAPHHNKLTSYILVGFVVALSFCSFIFKVAGLIPTEHTLLAEAAFGIGCIGSSVASAISISKDFDD